MKNKDFNTFFAMKKKYLSQGLKTFRCYMYFLREIEFSKYSMYFTIIDNDK